VTILRKNPTNALYMLILLYSHCYTFQSSSGHRQGASKHSLLKPGFFLRTTRLLTFKYSTWCSQCVEYFVQISRDSGLCFIRL